MSYPGTFAKSTPDHPAVVMATSGRVVTYSELDQRSNQLAHLLRRRGLTRGDRIAILSENHERFFDALWAALRSGLYYVLLNPQSLSRELSAILADAQVRAIVASDSLAERAAEAIASCPTCDVRLAFGFEGTALPGSFESYEAAVASMPSHPIGDESAGASMAYSSGTTGRPKGVVKPLPDRHPEEDDISTTSMRRFWGLDKHSVHLSPAPLHHAAPSLACIGIHRTGGTTVVMERWDAEGALAAIERYRCTHTQFVPTMFIRLLKLPDETRATYDVSSLRFVLHNAAPCPVDVKQQMLEWWGPIIWETYSASENPGLTCIGPEEALEHPGSVGRAMWGVLHILDENDVECPPGTIGRVFWENPEVDFTYHNDETSTAGARSSQGWWTVGDLGYVDEDGYLFLSGRASDMIISGGVNIHPREIEDVLVVHPDVVDVAVIGVPDDDMGERVRAIVRPVSMELAGPELEARLLEHCRSQLARYKCPRSIDFVEALPRQDTGKLFKRLLKG